MVPPLYQFPRAKAVVVESPLIGIQRDSSQSPPSPSVSSSNKISPAVLFIIVILAVIFFISGLLHLLVRFLIKKRPSSSHSPGRGGAESSASADALQRQLQQLFHLHDAGLDQAFIDALPVFLYREVVGTKEPFDCAVCLCEFAADDRLRLLPVCGHAFHLNCIDTWLLSNSTCPLCRGSLFVPGLTENPVFDFEEDGPLEVEEVEEAVVEKRVFPVRLGKFRSVSNQNNGGDGVTGTGAGAGVVDEGDICNSGREVGESSSSNLDARRCFSMGSYQYVLADANLQVELSSTSRRSRDANGMRLRVDDGVEGKRLGIASRGESFSVSKIWQWSNKKGRFPSDAPYLDGGLPWMVGRRSIGDT